MPTHPHRIIALIDGFNFYHPINEHQRRLKTCLQWLDYPKLLNYYIAQRPKAEQGILTEVYFFSALAKWRNKQAPGTTDRHLTYINALKQAQVQVILGNFKEKQNAFPYACPEAKTQNRCFIEKVSHEEKETDVRIACKLLELAFLDRFDTCFLLSADSDLVPAIETLKTLCPEKRIILTTPPSQAKFDKLKRLSHAHVAVGVNDLKKHQFPDAIQTANGYVLSNPWQKIATTV
jgi:uncharacterized LabA/DUF88 family protein